VREQSFHQNSEMASEKTNNRISQLEELILRQGRRIASLEIQLEKQNENLSERFNRQEQQIQSEIETLKAEIVGLKEENEIRQRERQQVGLNSEGNEVSELKTELIEQTILPERFFIPTADQFEGIIAHLTRKCGGIVGITASSV
jgi:hypothetical protein